MNPPATRRPLLFLLVLIMTRNLPAAEGGSASAAAPDSGWSVDDVMAGEFTSDFTISPDCQWAVWVKSTASSEKNEYVGNVFLSSLTDDHEVQLTRGPDGCSSPKWSPDSRRIAFLTSRPNPKAKADDKTKTQIWLMNPFGGEPWTLTRGERDVSSFEWVRTNEIIYLAQEAPSAYERTNHEKGDETKVIEDEAHEPPVRLFRIAVESGAVTPVTDNTDRIRYFSISPDGGHVVTIHERSFRTTYDQSARRDVFIADLKTGARKQIFVEPEYHLLVPITWQRDSQGFYAANAHTTHPQYSYPAVFELYHYTLDTGRTEKVDLDWERGLSTADLQATKDGFVARLADGVRPRLARYWQSGIQWRREWVAGSDATSILGFAIGNDGKTFVYNPSTSSRPDQWYRATLDGARIEAPRQLTRLNPGFQNKETARCEVVHWPGARGETVEGLLDYPMHYEAGRKYPLVVEIHGGPAWLFQDEWWDYPLYNNNLVNARGAFVFRPNYHGSAGYGLSWAESDLGRFGELEVEDINRGVDFLIDRGLVDSERLAVMGWSNGGTLTAAVTVATNRYKAAIAGDGPIEWVDYWAASDVGGWFCGSYFGESPLTNPETIIRFSPFYQMSKVTTPTLILFGEDDKRVPAAQGWMYYRALQQSGKAPVRFLVFPGEGHGPTKPVYLRRALDEELAWLEKYLRLTSDD